MAAVDALGHLAVSRKGRRGLVGQEGLTTCIKEGSIVVLVLATEREVSTVVSRVVLKTVGVPTGWGGGTRDGMGRDERDGGEDEERRGREEHGRRNT